MGQGRRTRNPLCHEIDLHEFPEGDAVLGLVFLAAVGEVELVLQQVHPENLLYAERRAPAFAG